MRDHVVAICKGNNAVLRNVPFIIKSIKASFVNFDGPQDVIHRLEGTESARCVFQCFQNSKKLLMTNLLFNIGLFIPLALIFDSGVV